MKIKSSMVLLMLVVSVMLAGCGGPPSDIVEGAVKKALDSSNGFDIGEIIDLDITNDYTQNQGDEKVYVYEFEAKVKHSTGMRTYVTNDEEGTYTGTVYLVKRGNSWYRL